MKCPYCGAPHTELKIVSTDHSPDHTRRRRECAVCNQRFSTAELVVKDRCNVAAKELVMIPKGLLDAIKIA